MEDHKSFEIRSSNLGYMECSDFDYQALESGNNYKPKLRKHKRSKYQEIRRSITMPHMKISHGFYPSEGPTKLDQPRHYTTEYIRYTEVEPTHQNRISTTGSLINNQHTEPLDFLDDLDIKHFVGSSKDLWDLKVSKKPKKNIYWSEFTEPTK